MMCSFIQGGCASSGQRRQALHRWQASRISRPPLVLAPPDARSAALVVGAAGPGTPPRHSLDNKLFLPGPSTKQEFTITLRVVKWTDLT